MIFVSELEKRKYPLKVLELLKKDVRLNNADIQVSKLHRYTYLKHREIQQFGVAVAFTVNLNSLIPNSGGLSFWYEEESDYLFVARHFGNTEIMEFHQNNIKEAVDCIVNMILEKEKNFNITHNAVAYV